MDLKQLRYFVRIVELESMTSAARSLFVAQPSLSQHVSNLELELGVKLLNRGVYGVKPTASGEQLYQYAKHILYQVQEASNAVKQKPYEPIGHVIIGMPTSTSHLLSIKLLSEVMQNYPQISIEIIEGGTSELIDSLSKQRMDMAIGVDVLETNKFDVIPIVKEQLLFVGSGVNPVSYPITLEKVCKYPLILSSFPNSIRARIERVCSEQGIQYKVIAESSVSSILLDAAKKGLAKTILPWSSLAREDLSILQVSEISDLPLNRILSLCISKNTTSIASCQIIKSILIDLISHKINQGVWHYAEFIA